MKLPQSRRRPISRLKRKRFPPFSWLVTLFLGAVLAYFANRIGAVFYLWQGNTLSEQNQPEQAIAAYQKAVAIDPKFALAYQRLGEELGDRARGGEAIAAYEQATKLDANFAEAYWHLGQALYQQQRFSEALKAYEKALELQPDIAIKAKDGKTYQHLGKLWADQGKWQEAIAAYRQATELAPEDGSAYYKLGLALAEVGNWSEAVTAYRESLALNPLAPNTYQHLGQALQQQERFAEAVRAYRAALELDPDNAEIYNHLGRVLVKEGKVQQAIQVYRTAMGLEPNRAETFNNLGEVLFQGGNWTQAIFFYRQAIQLDPKSAVAYKNLCYALHQQRQYPEAVKQCQQALAHDPYLSEVKFYLEEVQRQLTLRENPQKSKLPEHLPSLQQEPLLALKRSVVKIILKSPSGWGVGTGWLVKREGDKGWIVTNRHVVLKEKQHSAGVRLEVELYSQPLPGQVSLRRPAQLVQATAAGDWLDVAVLSVTGLPPDIQPLALSASEEELGTPIRAIGHPQTETDWTVLSGTITGQVNEMLKLSVIFAGGSSGSPVLNWQNQVVGVAVGIKFDCERDRAMELAGVKLPLSCSLALPSETVREQLQRWGLTGLSS